MKWVFSNVGKGTNFFRKLQSESCARVVLELGWGWVGLVNELRDSLTFVSI